MFGRRAEVALDKLGALPDEPATDELHMVLAEFARAVAIDLEAAGVPATQCRTAEQIFRAGA